jgi:serine/threonine protein kinase
MHTERADDRPDSVPDEDSTGMEERCMTLASASPVLQGRYEIESLLHQGGMSSVYLAYDRVLDGYVAVKQLRPEIMATDAVDLVKQEARMLARLDHRALPKVSNQFDEDGTWYMVMDYIDGESLLTKAHRQGGRLPDRLVLTWGYELSQVLEYLHRLKPQVLFRDLKPANVMVCRDGHIKLIDFGISKWVDTATGVASVGPDDLGTLGYAPPEQCGAAPGCPDPRSDIYALGATLYTALAFEVPVGSAERMAGPDELKPLSTLDPTIPEKVSRVIHKMMALNPAERYQTMREVRHEMARLLGGVPTVDELELPPELDANPRDSAPAKPEPLPETEPQPRPVLAVADGRARTWALAAAGLLALVGAAWWPWTHGAVPPAPPHAPARTATVAPHK